MHLTSLSNPRLAASLLLALPSYDEAELKSSRKTRSQIIRNVGRRKRLVRSMSPGGSKITRKAGSWTSKLRTVVRPQSAQQQDTHPVETSSEEDDSYDDEGDDDSDDDDDSNLGTCSMSPPFQGLDNLSFEPASTGYTPRLSMSRGSNSMSDLLKQGVEHIGVRRNVYRGSNSMSRLIEMTVQKPDDGSEALPTTPRNLQDSAAGSSKDYSRSSSTGSIDNNVAPRARRFPWKQNKQRADKAVLRSAKRTTAEAMQSMGIFTSELWPPPYAADVLNDPEYPPLILCSLPTWDTELGQYADSHDMSLFRRLVVPESDQYRPLYRQVFSNSPHHHYILSAAHSHGRGPFFFSVLRVGAAEAMVPVLVRSKRGFRLVKVAKTERIRKRLLKVCELDDVKPKYLVKKEHVFGDKLHQELLKEEDKRVLLSQRFAFGLLFTSGNQSENEIYSNQHGSPGYDYFLSLIAQGPPTQLLGFNGFRAGLDTTKTLCTGTTSIYTRFKDFEIMFHVGTMLPFDDRNEQQLPRKRHIGNDLVVLVYKEGPAPFDPSKFYSNMNQAFIVVEEISYDSAVELVNKRANQDFFAHYFQRPESWAATSESTSTVELHCIDASCRYYRVAFVAKEGTPLATPLFLFPCVIAETHLRSLLLTKMVNAHRNSYCGAQLSPLFARMCSEQVQSFQATAELD